MVIALHNITGWILNLSAVLAKSHKVADGLEKIICVAVLPICSRD